MWPLAHETPLTKLHFHDKISADIKLYSIRTFSHFCRKCLQVLPLERIRSSWKRELRKSAALHELKEVESSSSLRTADHCQVLQLGDRCRRTAGAVLQCVAGLCVRVMLHRGGATLKKPRHSEYSKVLTSLPPLFPAMSPVATQQCGCGGLELLMVSKSAEPTDDSSKVHHVSSLGGRWNLFQECFWGPEQISGDLVELREVWKKKDGRCFGQGSWISWYIAFLTFRSSAWYFWRARTCSWVSPQKGSHSGILDPSVPMSLWDVRCLKPHPTLCTHSTWTSSTTLCPSPLIPPVPMLETKADWETCNVSAQLQDKTRENRARVWLVYHSTRQLCPLAQPWEGPVGVLCKCATLSEEHTLSHSWLNEMDTYLLCIC